MRITDFRIRIVPLVSFAFTGGCCLLLACWLGPCGCTFFVVLVCCAWVEVRLDVVGVLPCCSFPRALFPLLLLFLWSAWLRRCRLLLMLLRVCLFCAWGMRSSSAFRNLEWASSLVLVAVFVYQYLQAWVVTCCVSLYSAVDRYLGEWRGGGRGCSFRSVTRLFDLRSC